MSVYHICHYESFPSATQNLMAKTTISARRHSNVQKPKKPVKDSESSSSEEEVARKPKQNISKKEMLESEESESESEPEQKEAKMMFDESESDMDEDEGAGFRDKGVESDDEESDMVSEEGEEDEERNRLMEVFELPEGEGEEIDPATLGKRIKEILGILSNFRKLAPKGKTRSDFMQQIIKDAAKYYGYLPTLIEMFLTIFSPDEMVEFLESNENPRPLVIRTNTLKARRRELAKALTSRGVSLEPLAEWSNVGLKVFESTVPIGATPEYLAGHYILQSASSFAPALALDPQPNEKVLDMASAPGGKTSYVAQLMRNTGLIIANDFKRDRINATVANLARLGVRNTIHCCHDGRQFPAIVGGFDRVLLDAPCSGLGVIQRDPSVKLSRTTEDINATAKLQKELILAAIDSVDHKSKTGGVIVYSTCSISCQENEMVVQYALEKRDVKILESGLEFGRPGLTRYQEHVFHPSMKLCKRLYPHVHNMDGFFVVKLKKLSAKGSPGADPMVGGEDDKKKKSKTNHDMDVDEEVKKVKKVHGKKKIIDQDTPEKKSVKVVEKKSSSAKQVVEKKYSSAKQAVEKKSSTVKKVAETKPEKSSTNKPVSVKTTAEKKKPSKTPEKKKSELTSAKKATEMKIIPQKKTKSSMPASPNKKALAEKYVEKSTPKRKSPDSSSKRVASTKKSKK